jgi:geranylgeranyl diphosphate synthase type II
VGPTPGGAGPNYPEHLRVEVERYLESLRFTADPVVEGLERAMRYSLLAGGKRTRPVLALATAEAIGMARETVLPLAGAIELIHTYSLIHDDLPAMDDDDLRRGRPTCHKAFGEDVAILAGDALYAEAFKLLLGQPRGDARGPQQADPRGQPRVDPGGPRQPDPRNLLAAAERLAGATGVDGMVGGQYIDVTESAPPGPGGLRRLHELKTGRLIAASIDCVLLLDGTLERDRIAFFGSFAAELGVLFQIVDDILDVIGSSETLGKRQGSDERLGKRTYVTEFGLEGARGLAAHSRDRARAALAQAAPGGATELEQITDFIANRTY